MYALNKLSELLKKMLLNDKSAPEPQSFSQSTSDFQREFECPICFEEMRPPTRIWQCVDGHAICEGRVGPLQLRDLRCCYASQLSYATKTQLKTLIFPY